MNQNYIVNAVGVASGLAALVGLPAIDAQAQQYQGPRPGLHAQPKAGQAKRASDAAPSSRSYDTHARHRRHPGIHGREDYGERRHRRWLHSGPRQPYDANTVPDINRFGDPRRYNGGRESIDDRAELDQRRAPERQVLGRERSYGELHHTMMMNDPDVCFAIRYGTQVPGGRARFTNIGGSSTFSKDHPENPGAYHEFCVPYRASRLTFTPTQLSDLVDKASQGQPQRPISWKPKGEWDATFTPIGVEKAAMGIYSSIEWTTNGKPINPQTYGITKSRTLAELPRIVDGSVPLQGYAQIVFPDRRAIDGPRRREIRK